MSQEILSYTIKNAGHIGIFRKSMLSGMTAPEALTHNSWMNITYIGGLFFKTTSLIFYPL